MLKHMYSIIVVLASVLLSGCPQPKSLAAKQSAPLPTQVSQESTSDCVFANSAELDCSLLNEEIYDVPAVTRVVRKYLIEGTPTEENLEELLMRKYSEAIEETGFQYSEHPTAVFLYAFTDEERATSTPFQWLAMLQKTDSGGPTFQFSEQQFDLLNSVPTEKHGLSEQERLAIWHEVCWYEDRALEEAAQKYPDPKDWQASLDFENNLIEQYRNEVAERRGIPYDVLMEIYGEGAERGWSYPPKDYIPPAGT